MADDLDDPGSGPAACKRMLDIIKREVWKNKERVLEDSAGSSCVKQFTNGDSGAGNGNEGSFSAHYKSDGWESAKHRLVKAAHFHAQLCNLLADYDDPDGREKTITLEAFTAAGRLVKFACPPPSKSTPGRPAPFKKMGAWCSWP